MKIILALIFINNLAFGAWIMFSDKEDTYIYNSVSGDIFIRHKKGGNNYEDAFIKMPSGVILQNKNVESKQTESNLQPNRVDSKLDSIKMEQDKLNERLMNLQNDMLKNSLE